MWLDNKFHGQGEENYISGNFYKGQFKFDKRCGTGTLTYANGCIYKGEWKTNLKEGKG